MTDAIALQARCDEQYTLLRRDGYRDAADLILHLRRAVFERQERLDRIHTLIAQKVREESDR